MRRCRSDSDSVPRRAVSERGATENYMHERLASFLVEASVEQRPTAPRRPDGMTGAARRGERASCQCAQMARRAEILLIGRTQARCACASRVALHTKK